MQAAGPVRLKEVEEAQQAMITAAKDLAESGEIVIGGGPGDDQLVF
jgi:flagellar motor switch protein FliG